MVHRETFLKIYLKLNEPTVDSFRTARSLAATHCEPVSLNTGRLAACTDELERNTQKLGNTYIEICKEVFKLESSTLAEAAYPQNCMVEQPRNQRISITSLIPSTFQCWKTSFQAEVWSCSNFPTEALLWIKEVERVESVDDLKTHQSIGGRLFPNVEMLDAKIASALKKIIQNSSFKNVPQRETRRFG